MKRRGWDSNPRGRYEPPKPLSRRLPSASRPPLRVVSLYAAARSPCHICMLIVGPARVILSPMREPPDVDYKYCRKPQAVDRELAGIATRQHGVVSRRQLLALGLSARSINHRLAIGRLHPIHRGVYMVGHARITARGRWMAAVLACGPGALLSHRSAAALWDLAPAACRNRRHGA